MYLLFRYKNIKPLEYYSMKKGEKTICRAFMELEIKERMKIEESMLSIFT